MQKKVSESFERIESSKVRLNIRLWAI